MVTQLSIIEAQARDIERELVWLDAILRWSLKQFQPDIPLAKPADAELLPPKFDGSDSLYATYVRSNDFPVQERLTLALSLAPHVRPSLLDHFFVRNQTYDRQFTEFGGEIAGGAFHPTGETLAFIVGGNSVEKRVAQTNFLFDPTHVFATDGVLSLVTPRDAPEQLPRLHRRLCMSLDAVARFTTGAEAQATLGNEFPAKLITTALNWEDLVLAEQTRAQLADIDRWIAHHATMLEQSWKITQGLSPGFRCLFHGPPGTGKSISAALLGKRHTKPVYRIDLSLVVSKWIGETEKNLGRLFDFAQGKGWILFFDEADALFGKRTDIRDSHDRYANQEVSYLLQRIEGYQGIVILATNLKSNIDTAFLRRFESIVHFPMPGVTERARLWKQNLPLPEQCLLGQGIEPGKLAATHELSGAAIVSVLRDASLLALEAHASTKKSGPPTLTHEHLRTALEKEYRKEGRTMNL